MRANYGNCERSMGVILASEVSLGIFAAVTERRVAAYWSAEIVASP